MIYTDLTKKAIRIAYEAHQGQEDRGHTPYICHVLHVAETMNNESAAATAILHDILEDTEETADSLRQKGIPEQIIRNVQLLTRGEGESYEVYMERILSSGNEDVIRVKYADLCHNLDVTRAEGGRLPEKLLKRYRKARKQIEDTFAFKGKTDG